MLTRENHRLDIVVFAQLPDEELGEVARVDELTERFTGASYDEWRAVFCETRR